MSVSSLLRLLPLHRQYVRWFEVLHPLHPLRFKDEVFHIQRHIKTVGDSMSSKMQDLQSTANDVGNVAGKSLANQLQLLDGQSKVMVGQSNLYNFQA
uniref:Uncharacterized protein n=1 Tax=Oryza punctata TaxID=4537 RepID=A0A0E0LC73_ORYPU